MQLYCLRLGRLIEEGSLTDDIAAIAKMNNTRKARQVVVRGPRPPRRQRHPARLPRHAAHGRHGGPAHLRGHRDHPDPDRRAAHHGRGGLHVTDRMRTVRVLGHDVRVATRAGTGAGPPSCSATASGPASKHSSRSWTASIPAIEVIRFDVPGVGGSPDPCCPTTSPCSACLVGRLLTQLGHDRFDVLGISWGGGLAQQLAFQFPRRCRRVVLVATATGCLMVPAMPWVLAQDADAAEVPRRELRPEHRRRAVRRSAARRPRTRRPPAPGPHQGRVPDAGTSSSSWPASAGRAFRCCRSSGSARSSSPAPTTRSSRSSTRGSWTGCSHTPGSASTPTATSGWSPWPTSSAPSWPTSCPRPRENCSYFDNLEAPEGVPYRLAHRRTSPSSARELRRAPPWRR